MATTEATLSTADRALVLRALKYPRGRYSAERASQLSSIPSRTLHDWATAGALVPDWVGARPRGWSYRDVIYARLLGWLRSKHMDRSAASARVGLLRDLLASADIDPSVHSDGTIFLIGEDVTDRFTGQQAFDGLAELLDVFELTEAIEVVALREFDRSLTGSSVPDWYLYLRAQGAGFDALVTRDWHQSEQIEELWTLAHTDLSVVTWRRPIEDPVREWGQLLAYLPEVTRMITDNGPSIVFFRRPDSTARASTRRRRCSDTSRATSASPTSRCVTKLARQSMKDWRRWVR